MHRRALVAALALTLAGGAFSAAVGQPAGPSQDPAAAPAGEYVLDKNHASVIARVKHLGLSNFTIRFDNLDASYTFDPKNPAASKVQATVDASVRCPSARATSFPGTRTRPVAATSRR